VTAVFCIPSSVLGCLSSVPLLLHPSTLPRSYSPRMPVYSPWTVVHCRHQASVTSRPPVVRGPLCPPRIPALLSPLQEELPPPVFSPSGAREGYQLDTVSVYVVSSTAIPVSPNTAVGRPRVAPFSATSAHDVVVRPSLSPVACASTRCRGDLVRCNRGRLSATPRMSGFCGRPPPYAKGCVVSVSSVPPSFH
jgi:hypothetical protein